MPRSDWPGAARGFTLIELLVVLLILGIAAAGVSLALPDGHDTQLERESVRLVALLESARAESRASGRPVRWTSDTTGFTLVGGAGAEEPAPAAMQHHTWLQPNTRAVVVQPSGQHRLVLGPEPILPAQRVVLSVGPASLSIATDGLRPFAIEPTPGAAGS